MTFTFFVSSLRSGTFSNIFSASSCVKRGYVFTGTGGSGGSSGYTISDGNYTIALTEANYAITETKVFKQRRGYVGWPVQEVTRAELDLNAEISDLKAKVENFKLE